MNVDETGKNKSHLQVNEYEWKDRLHGSLWTTGT